MFDPLIDFGNDISGLKLTNLDFVGKEQRQSLMFLFSQQIDNLILNDFNLGKDKFICSNISPNYFYFIRLVN